MWVDVGESVVSVFAGAAARRAPRSLWVHVFYIYKYIAVVFLVSHYFIH